MLITDSSLFSVNELLSFLAWPVLAGLANMVTRIAPLHTVCILVVTPCIHCTMHFASSSLM